MKYQIINMMSAYFKVCHKMYLQTNFLGASSKKIKSSEYLKLLSSLHVDAESLD